MTSKLRNTSILLGAAVLATILAYWPGLAGPFLLDDEPNLSAIPLWLSGQLDLRALLLERGAGLFGRPVSMASFAVNAWIGGYTPFSLKVGNLVVHLACGLALFIFLRRLLSRDARLASHAPLYAVLATALWLLHPLHASTVLYVVQRMAQLSTLFILLGLWAYVVVRTRVEHSPSGGALLAMFLGIPAMTGLAFLAKENGILLPLLCGVLELAYFPATNGQPRPRAVRWFLALYVVVPCLIALAGFLFRFDWFNRGYVGRDFTMAERLLSQGRALCDYLWKLLAPNPPSMGVYTDDFPVSLDLFTPVTTVPAILLLLFLSLLAWHWRRSHPSVFFGWFFFLVSHSLEAGPIPLEIYFEHRNYLPSAGVIIAGIGIASAAWNALSRQRPQPAKLAIFLASIIFVVLAAGTHGRARVWKSELLIVESSLAAHPRSLRANAAVLTAAINHGDRQRASEIIGTLVNSEIPRHRSLGRLYRFYASCALEQQANPRDIEQFSEMTPMPLTLAEVVPLQYLFAATAQNRCRGASDDEIGAALAALANRASLQPDGIRAKIVMRYYAAQFHVRNRSWNAALRPAQLAWQPGAEPGIAGPLLLSQLGIRDFEQAEITYREIASRSEPGNAEDQAGLRWIRQEMEAARAAYKKNP